MEVEVVEASKDRVKFILHGVGHTFCNNLKHELYGEKDVDVAAYTIDHPLVGKPTFIVQKSGAASFEKLLKSTVARIKKQNDAFGKAVAKAK